MGQNDISQADRNSIVKKWKWNVPVAVIAKYYHVRTDLIRQILDEEVGIESRGRIKGEEKFSMVKSK